MPLRQKRRSGIRVLIVARAVARGAGLSALLAEAASAVVVGVIPSTAGLPSRIEALQPDVLVVDSGPSGNVSINRVTQGVPQSLPVVLLSDQSAAAAQFVRAGIRAVLSRDAPAAELDAAINAAALGLMVWDPTLANNPRALAVEVEHGSTEVEALTPREIEVLRMLAEGLGNKEIAHRLGISDNTVKFHISSILSKMGVSSRTEAVTHGIRSGLIPI